MTTKRDYGQFPDLSKLSVFDKHQLAIARRTLQLSDMGALILGGMTKAEARLIIYKLTGKQVRP